MIRTTPWLAAMLVLCPLGAQDPAATPKAAPAIDAATRLEQLSADADKIVEVWRAQQKEAAAAAKDAKPGSAIPAMSMRPDFSPLCAKYLAAAKEFPGDDAIQFLMPALQMSGEPAQRELVITQLLDEHLDSPALAPLGGMLPYLASMTSEEFAASAMQRIEKHGKNMTLLGWAAFGKHEATLRSKPAKSKEFLEAKAIIAAALEKAGDKRLQQQFDSLVAEQETFAMGMQAPDISGLDLDGVEFKLSDYKGKVVFLDFWGDW